MSVNAAGEPDHGVFLRALEVEAIPEPNGLVVWIGLATLIFCIAKLPCLPVPPTQDSAEIESAQSTHFNFPPRVHDWHKGEHPSSAAR